MSRKQDLSEDFVTRICEEAVEQFRAGLEDKIAISIGFHEEILGWALSHALAEVEKEIVELEKLVSEENRFSQDISFACQRLKSRLWGVRK